MHINLISIDLSTLDKSTLFFVFAGQVAVVVILFLLYKLYKLIVSSFSGFHGHKDISSEKEAAHSLTEKYGEEDINAAIALALYLHLNEIHDEESNVITIQRVSKTYSPWSSKIYSVRNFRRF